MDLASRWDRIATDRAKGAAERLHALLRAAWEWEMSEFPERATWTGFPGQDDRWTDRSRAAIERRRRGTEALLESARRIARVELAAGDQLHLDLFVREIEQSVEEKRWPVELLAITQMDGVQQDPAQLLALAPAGSERKLEDVVARLERLPALIEQTIALLEEGLARGITPPRVTLRDVPRQVENLVGADPGASALLAPFARMPPELAHGEGRRLAQAARGVLESAILPALRRLRGFLVERYLPGAREATAWRDLPDGEAWYAFKVREQTTTKLAPQEIHRIGLEEVARIRARLEQTMREAGHAGDFASFCEFLRTDPRFYFRSGEELVKEYRDICKRIDPRLTALFGRLPRLPYGVTEVPAHSAESQTTAYYLPGTPEAARPGWFHANTSKLGSRPRWEMEALSLHEAVPGHHLQIALAQELDLPEFRRHGLGCTAFVEGWALYAESLGGELDCYRDPWSRFGRFSYEMWRAIRLVVDTGMHALGWSRERAIEYFAGNTGKPLHDITVEIDRYLVWPAQALAYKIGELEIARLRREASAALGERFDLRAFHDELLGEGALPLDLLAARMRAWVERRKGTAP